jgi:hypothetical protein
MRQFIAALTHFSVACSQVPALWASPSRIRLSSVNRLVLSFCGLCLALVMGCAKSTLHEAPVFVMREPSRTEPVTVAVRADPQVAQAGDTFMLLVQVRIPTPPDFKQEIKSTEIEVLPLVQDYQRPWKAGWCSYALQARLAQTGLRT